MDNHYHLLVETKKANISKIMHAFQSSYANWFRVRHRLNGSIFQSRYKSVVVENMDYLLHLSAYIHLNPVRAKMAEKPEDYIWSSYLNYLGLFADEITTTKRILEVSGGIENYKYIVDTSNVEREFVYGNTS